MTGLLATAARSLDTVNGTGQLLVTVRRPSSAYEPTGYLDIASDQYEFAYLRCALDHPEFVPLLGFPHLDHTYARPYLFPLFAERVMSPRRPDREEYLVTLRLGVDATPLEVLTRSGGHRHGDTIELVPMPTVDGGGVTSTRFLVHGVRYRGDVVTERIEQLESGHELTLIPDPANEADPLAVGVHDSDGLLLGYVPKAFTRYVRALSTIAVSVEVASGPAVSYHLRLLVRLEGLLPAGMEPFAGPEWEPASPMRTVGSAV